MVRIPLDDSLFDPRLCGIGCYFRLGNISYLSLDAEPDYLPIYHEKKRETHAEWVIARRWLPLDSE